MEELRLIGARSDHMEMLLRKLEEMGMEWQEDEDGLTARVLERLQSVDVSTLPYPGLATDYKPFLVAALAYPKAREWLLKIFCWAVSATSTSCRMGAEIRAEGRHACSAWGGNDHQERLFEHMTSGREPLWWSLDWQLMAKLYFRMLITLIGIRRFGGKLSSVVPK